MMYSPRVLVWASLLIAHIGALRLDPVVVVVPRFLSASLTATASLTPVPPEPPGVSILPGVKPGSETASISRPTSLATDLPGPASEGGDKKPPPFPTYTPDPADVDGESRPPPIQTIEPDPADVSGDGETGIGKPTGSGTGSPIKAPRPPISSYTPPAIYPNMTSSAGDHTTTGSASTSCSSLSPEEPVTVWIVLPNPNTVTVTVGWNSSTSVNTLAPEFTPPIYCAEPASTPVPPKPPPVDSTSGTSAPAESSRTKTMQTPFLGRPTSTFITTSKNPVTIYTTPTLPRYPGGKITSKETVKPSADPRPLNPPASLLPPGSRPHSPFPPLVGAPTFTAGPIIDGSSGTTKAPPVPGPVTNTGGAVRDRLVPTIIQGVTVGLAPSFAVIEGTTYTFADTPQTISAGGMPVSVGPSGLGFPQVTVAPPPQSTNVVILDGKVFSAVESSLAVFDGKTLTYGTSSTFTTEFHGEAITLGDSISYDGTTLGGVLNTGTQLGIAGGLSVTEIDSSVAVISSTSLTVGPQAVPKTIIVDTYTITANSNGLELAGTTLSYPFNPSIQAITAGGITFSQIASTIVVVGGSTYTIGAGSRPTSTVFNGQTISFGPGGIGFSTTTFVSTTSSSTSTSAGAAETGKKSGVGALKPLYGVLEACIIICIGYVM